MMKAILKILVISILFHSFQQVAQAALTPEPPDLYEQPMLADPNFQSLPRVEQDQILRDHFLSRKRSPLDNRVMWLSAGLVALGAVGTYFYSIFNQFKAKGDQLGEAEQVLLAGVTIGVTTVGPILAPSFFSYIYSTFANRYWDRKHDPLEALELDYIAKKRFLPVKFQKQIEEQFNLSRQYSTYMGIGTEFVQIALELPLKNKKAEFNQERIQTLFSGYSAALLKKVTAFTLRQVMNQTASTREELMHFKKGKRVAAFFHGAPGSGKTRFAELIAQALELPFARISLEGANISDVVGRSPYSDSPTPGLLAKAMANAKWAGSGARNMVLFIDEADRVINNTQPGSSEMLPFMLKLLDPENKEYYNPYFSAEVDISGLTIILAGNYQINDEALRKRLFVVNFEGFDPAFKKKIIWESTLPKLCESYSQNGERSISLADFTELDHAIIDRLVEADLDPGFRTIENALMYFMDYKAIKKYFNPSEEAPDFMQLILESNQEWEAENKKRQAA